MVGVKDRLQELLSVSTETNDREYTAIPMNENVNQFLQKVADARETIENIRSDTERMKTLFNQSTFYASKTMQDEMDSLLTSSLKKTKSATQMLKDIERSIDSSNKTEQRIRFIQYNGLIKLYKDVTIDNSQFLEVYKEKHKSMLKQQAKLTNGNLTDTEIDEMLEDGKFALFTDNILASTQVAKQNLADIETRHKELLKIESNIRELKDMFVKMGELISLQQETVDRIESYSVETRENVDKGTNELKEGYILMTKAKKKKYILIAVLIIVVIVLLVLMYYL